MNQDFRIIRPTSRASGKGFYFGASIKLNPAGVFTGNSDLTTGQSHVAGTLTAAGAMSAKIKGRGKLARTFARAKQNRLSIDEIIADELELVELGVLPYVLTRRDGGERLLDEIIAEEDAMILAGAM